MMKNIFFFSIILLFSALSLTNATIIYVRGDVSGTWSVDTVMVIGEISVPPNSTLIIQPGVKVLFQVYCKFIVEIDATLRAIGTAQDTILFDNYLPNDYWHGIRFSNASDSCRLEYCHLINSYASGSGSDAYGGAIYCAHSNITVQNCLIDNCFACGFHGGGGIACLYSPSPTIQNCLIYRCGTAYHGGGIYCLVSNPSIIGNTIKGNSADQTGGGIHCNGSIPFISGNIISENSAFLGGGINCTSSSATFESNEISNNIASGDGAGLWLAGNYNLNKCTVVNNYANNGGGIWLYPASTVGLDNCILWGNYPQQIYADITSNVLVTYSDIQGNWPGAGNINANPLFADPANGDYHLTWANFPLPDYTKSLCIDAGDTNSIMYIDPDSTRADMGCYFFDQRLPIDNLIISIESNNIILQWFSIPIASFYHIYRSTEPYFDLTGINPIASTMETYYVDTNALFGNKYYYHVTYEY